MILIRLVGIPFYSNIKLNVQCIFYQIVNIDLLFGVHRHTVVHFYFQGMQIIKFSSYSIGVNLWTLGKHISVRSGKDINSIKSINKTINKT